ncbi:MAG: DUF4082 domain-containing protein, partial [Elusimicrobiota bacterium]
GGNAFTLTATGNDFISGSTILWNGLERTTTFISATSLTALIPASDLTSSGTVNVSVFTSTPGGGTSASQIFTINQASNPAPVLLSISPSSTTVGGSAFTLTASGNDFIADSIIRWNGLDRVTAFINSTSLTAVIPVSDIISSGTANVTVYTSTPGGGVSTSQLFTINQPLFSTTTYTIWPATAVPATQSPDPNIEIGIKFTADVSGTVVGIRFYKHSFNTGIHTGHLWSSTGTLLGSVTFTSETTSGWQQANFSTPILISSNTTYVASYFTTKGYGVTRNYFTASGVDNSPLHATRSVTGNRNGVFKYGSTSGFPNSSYQDTNYWVDVAFKKSIGGGLSVKKRGLPTPIISLKTNIYLTEEITVQYPEDALIKGFEWNFTRKSLETGIGSQNSNTIKALSTLPQGKLKLQDQNLLPGNYRLGVTAVGLNNEMSKEASLNVILLAPTIGSARIFPDPWKKNQHEGIPLTFDGLPHNCILKIFTLSAQLVKTLEVVNGSVTWDRKNSEGDTIASGIYIYIAIDDSGKKTQGKFAVIN